MFVCGIVVTFRIPAKHHIVINGLMKFFHNRHDADDAKSNGTRNSIHIYLYLERNQYTSPGGIDRKITHRSYRCSLILSLISRVKIWQNFADICEL